MEIRRVTLPNRALEAAFQAALAFGRLDGVPALTSYKAARIIRALAAPAADLSRARARLATTYVARDEAGKPVPLTLNGETVPGVYQPVDGRAFREQEDALLDATTTVDVPTFTLAEWEQVPGLRAEVTAALLPFIDEPEPVVSASPAPAPEPAPAPAAPAAPAGVTAEAPVAQAAPAASVSSVSASIAAAAERATQTPTPTPTPTAAQASPVAAAAQAAQAAQPSKGKAK